MIGFITSIRRGHWLLLLLLIFFIPFPTQMVPAWRIQFRDGDGNPLGNRVVEQRWTSYTYFAVDGYDQRCTDTEGTVTFPERYLWSGIFARGTSPLIAKVMIINHGSEGTDAAVRLYDRYYASKEYYWDDKMSLYTHNPDGTPPFEGTAEPREPCNNLPTCETIH